MALLVVLLFGGLFSLADAVQSHDFTQRGLLAAERSTSDARLGAMRASAAVRESLVDTAAFDAALADAAAAESSDGSGVRTWDLSVGELRAFAQAGFSDRVAAIESDDALDDSTRARQTQSAAQQFARALSVIEEVRPRGLFEAFAAEERRAAPQFVTALIDFDLPALLAVSARALIQAPMRLWEVAPWMTSLVLLIVFATGSFAATALCRMSALDLARGQKLSAREGAWYAADRATRCLLLPIAPIGLVLVLLFVPALYGVLLALPMGDIIAAMLFPIALVFALLASVVLIVSFSAMLLYPAAAAVEDADLPDAITRSASFVIARPLLWLGVLSTSLVTLAMGGILVSLLLQVTEALTLIAASVVMGPRARTSICVHAWMAKRLRLSRSQRDSIARFNSSTTRSSSLTRVVRAAISEGSATARAVKVAGELASEIWSGCSVGWSNCIQRVVRSPATAGISRTSAPRDAAPSPSTAVLID